MYPSDKNIQFLKSFLNKQQVIQIIKKFGILSGSVDTIDDLPPASEHKGEVWLVETDTSGIFSPSNAGFYTSNGSVWTKIPIEFDVSNKVDKINITPFTKGSATKTISINVNEQGQVVSSNEHNLESGNITETTNLYYTDERVDDEVNTLIQDNTGISWVYDDALATLTPVLSDTLAEISGLGTAADKILYTTAINTWEEADLSAYARTNILNVASELAFQQSVNLEIGVDVQAYSARLTDIAALTPTDGNFQVGNGTTWVAESGATARSSLGLGTTDDVEFNSIKTEINKAITPNAGYGFIGLSGSPTLFSGGFFAAYDENDALEGGNVLVGYGTTNSDTNSNASFINFWTGLGVYFDKSGNIALDGTVDGVDIASFKSSYDSFVASIDETAQDAVGGILTDSSEIDFTYDDATPSITASIVAGSIANSKLANSTISGVALGSNLGTLTISSPLSGISYNGSTGVSIGLASGYGDSQNPYASKTANYFLAAPNGVGGVPSFRAVVAADIPTLNQNTTGSAATLTTTRTLWGQNFNGSANVSGSLTDVGDITGGASNMVITAGTGNSRTLTFKTTTSGGVKTTALTLDANQRATFANNVNATNLILSSVSSGNEPVAYINFAETGFYDRFYVGCDFSGTGNNNRLLIGANSTGALPAEADAKIIMLQDGSTSFVGAITTPSVNKVAITAPATSATLTIANDKTFTSSNTLTLAGTDGSTLNIGTGGTLGTAAYTASSNYALAGANTNITSLNGLTGAIFFPSNIIMANSGGGVRANLNAGDAYRIQANDTSGAGYTTFITITSGNPPTCDLSTSVTRGGVAIVDLSSSQTLTNKSIVATQLTGTLQAGQFPALIGDISTSTGSLTTAIGANKVVNSMIRQSSALSVIGRSSSTTGNVADISAASDNQILRRSGTSIGFGAINLASSSAVSGTLANTNTTATSANTASAIVARDASGNFSSGAITITTDNALGLQVGDSGTNNLHFWSDYTATGYAYLQVGGTTTAAGKLRICAYNTTATAINTLDIYSTTTNINSTTTNISTDLSVGSPTSVDCRAHFYKADPSGQNGVIGYFQRNGAGDVAISFSQKGTSAYAIVHPSGGGLAFYNNRYPGDVGTKVASFDTSYNFKLDGGGVGYQTGGGSWTAISDEREKKNINPISDGLEKILALNPVHFDWIDSSKKDGGFIAQEVQKIFPQFIEQTKNKDGKERLALHLPFEFDAYLVSAIQKLNKKITDLESRI